MPLYDCMLLLKPHVKKEALMDLVARVGKHVYRRNGVLTDMKSFGTVQLGYGIKKLDGRYYQLGFENFDPCCSELGLFQYVEREQELEQNVISQISLGQLMQMTMMTPPSFNNELHYLNREDRLLRWLLVKHRDIKYGLEFLSEDDGKGDLSKFRSSLYGDDDIDDDEDDDDDEDEEYEADQEEMKLE
ncbi:hypothetical protein TEA_023005 [Camellia sinensis var. sinensis]|uniref:Uncharacterized protein n=1 Tax=Camellia sinensis var. sinensis TaxID=542762 RepID=A0A4S4E8R3_CAMSN|nr:hypothetical protein TEA_023005 [Camellia sinensis var. sinensis]